METEKALLKKSESAFSFWSTLPFDQNLLQSNQIKENSNFCAMKNENDDSSLQQ